MWLRGLGDVCLRGLGDVCLKGLGDVCLRGLGDVWLILLAINAQVDLEGCTRAHTPRFGSWICPWINQNNKWH